ncbi:MAG: heme biosynthesis protein HemY [Betaproteobacteria bacterium]|nr:heme biosynthesis protein HemY [Betaproteobacteria bacterium]MDH5352255.1 heme biosynthesis protein HemY [Betaproteobacteria bacterium]
MRSLFWLLAVFAAAAALAVLARLDQGYVRIAYGEWRGETSLLFFAVLALLAFVAAFAAVRILQHTLALPTYVRAYRARRQRDRAQAALAGALQAWLEGRYSRAEKEATRAYDGGAAPGLAAVIAARAAHELGVPERREQWLGRAHEESLRNAAQLSRAVMALGERDYGAARDALKSLQGSGARHIATLRLLLRAERGLRNWEEVLRLTAQLAKRDAIAPGVAGEYRLQAHLELLAQAAAERAAFEERWRRVPANERAIARIATAAVRHALPLGLAELAREALERALAEDWSSALAALYGELPHLEPAARVAEARVRIERAERWLLEHEGDAQLLAALGRLCAHAELWGKAQSYLETSLSFGETSATHLALARLLDRLERGAEAQPHYRRAAELA